MDVDAAGQVVIRRQLNRLEAGAGLVVMAAPASLLSPNGPPVGTPGRRIPRLCCGDRLGRQRKAAIRRDQHVAEGPTPDMQRRIVDRVEPKTLFPFGAPGEGPRACGTIRWASPVIDTGSRFWFSPHSVG